jgi:hypothetical protein
MIDWGRRRRKRRRWSRGEASQDVPFELVGKVARAGAVAKAGDVERGSASARHGVGKVWPCKEGVVIQMWWLRQIVGTPGGGGWVRGRGCA